MDPITFNSTGQVRPYTVPQTGTYNLSALGAQGGNDGVGTPDLPVCLDIAVDGAVVASMLANKHRPDVAAAGHGDGRFGYEVVLPVALGPSVPHAVEVRRSADETTAGLVWLEALSLPLAA